MLFYFDFANYFTMMRLAWKEKSPQVRFYFMAVLCVWVPLVSSFHALCFFLDGILFPGLKRVEVKEPVFLVGHARSGTTLTHRLMNQDEGRFSCFLLYECYFPSLLQKKLIRLGIAFDRDWLGGLLARRVARWEERRYGRSRHMHAMGLTIPEEDDIALYYSMASGFWITKMPYMGDLDFYHMNDWPEAKRRRTNDFYRECVKRQLYLNGPDKTHLAKNPLWAGRVASLLEAFPDAKFVVNVRDPRATIPSLLKLVHSGWKQLGWEEARQRRCLQLIADQSWHSYRHPLETLEAHPDIQGSVVDYRDLTRDPAAAIEGIYRDLGFSMSQDFRQILASEGKRQRDRAPGRSEGEVTGSKDGGGGGPRHRYSLEEYGLDADVIQQQLGDLFERFQWEADDAPAGDGAPGGTQ